MTRALMTARLGRVMRILFTSLRNAGHFLPLVPFIDACRRKGVEAAVAAPADLSEQVKATGATFFPFGHPGDEGLRPIWAKLRGAPREELGRVVFAEIFAGICASTALPALLETMDRFRPSMIVRESQEYAGLLAAEKFGVPHIRVAISARNGEEERFSLCAGALDGHRRTIGLPPDPAAGHLRGEMAFTLFPASLESADAAKGPVRRFRAVRSTPKPLPDHWSGSKEPFVYVTLGTVAGTMDDMKSTYGVVMEALRGTPVRALLTIGKDLPMEALGEVPGNVHVERFVPQDDVIPHAAAVVCHGGSGTTLGTLAAGVPVVVVPMFADQPDNAERVEAAGAGLAMPPRAATADGIRRALVRVLAESSFRDVARKIAAEMAALPPTDDAVAELEALLHAR